MCGLLLLLTYSFTGIAYNKKSKTVLGGAFILLA